ncbi:DUF1491 family protein [Pedomonas sp. V897]|uniref:DUF1491 family protein n=1 Tax=Pedomonas sp. V897 TaxID=3446482 RepID=UPI003EDEB8F9
MMMLPRLTTRFWVSALVRRCNAEGVPATVIRHGYDEAGAVLLLAHHRDGRCRLFGATLRQNGDKAWLALTGAEPVNPPEADALIEKQRRFDPDLWVVELETDRPENFLDEAVIAS